MRASLEGPAVQVLWDAGQCTSVDDLIRLLKNRFGSLNEEEHYCSELKAQRRRRGESLQSVYQDIRRLMALSFPDQSGPMWDIVVCDAFVNSLGDPALWLRVLERDPTSLEEALKVVSRLEALGGCESDDSWDDWGHRRNKSSKTAISDGKEDDNQQLNDLIRDLRKELKENREKMERQRRGVREVGS